MAGVERVGEPVAGQGQGQHSHGSWFGAIHRQHQIRQLCSVWSRQPSTAQHRAQVGQIALGQGALQGVVKPADGRKRLAIRQLGSQQVLPGRPGPQEGIALERDGRARAQAGAPSPGDRRHVLAHVAPRQEQQGHQADRPSPLGPSPERCAGVGGVASEGLQQHRGAAPLLQFPRPILQLPRNQATTAAMHHQHQGGAPQAPLQPTLHWGRQGALG